MVVKTVSGSVASWPATGNVTTRPLPVLDTIKIGIDESDITKGADLEWEPNPDSLQDKYKIKVRNLCLKANQSEEYAAKYYQLETCINNAEDKSMDNAVFVEHNAIFGKEGFIWLQNLQPGRNYTISISAVSQGIESVERIINLAIDTEEIRQLKQEKATSKSSLINIYLLFHYVLTIGDLSITKGLKLMA